MNVIFPAFSDVMVGRWTPALEDALRAKMTGGQPHLPLEDRLPPGEFDQSNMVGKPIDMDELRRLAAVPGMTSSMIAKRMKIGRARVERVCGEEGIEVLRPKKAGPRPWVEARAND